MEREEVIDKFSEFLTKKYYLDLLTAANENRKSIEIDFKLLEMFDAELADYLLDNAEEALMIFQECLNNIDISDPKIRLRFFNLPESREIRIRNIRSEHIGKMIVVDGIVKRASEVRPEVSEAIFECVECGTRMSIIQTERTISYPSECENPSCGSRKKFKLVDRKLFDARWIVVEEPFEITSGERPSDLMIYLKEDLTSPKMQNKTDPGNRIKVVGILKELPKKIKGSRSRQMDIYLDANHVQSVDIEWEDVELTPEDEKKIIELAKDPNIYKKLVNSIAPTIYGLEEVKEAIVLQLFGGVQHIQKDKSRVRGDIHILLVGDPSTAKSALMKVVSGLIPRGRYVSGKGVTASGLTATVVKDEEFLGGWVLEAGAIVMCNKSLCCIDEFEKIEKTDQVALHETMEQQSYHPNTQIMLSDGTKRYIGELVDELIEKNKDKVIKGRNCEILPVKGLKVLTTDFRKIYEVEVDRVSRHVAPKEFIKITYSNGRTILVTPEHPIWILEGSSIKTIPAENVVVGTFTPVPKKLPIQPAPISLTMPQKEHYNEKDIVSPKTIDEKLTRALGYYISEGHNFVGERSSEIGFSNTQNYILNDIKSVMFNSFGLIPYSQPHLNNVVVERYISTQLYRFFKINFPEIMKKAKYKSIPAALLRANDEVIRSFLSAAYLGDGFVDSERFGFITASAELAKGYQELLLRLGIYSYLTWDRTSDAYKVVVSGLESMKMFLEYVVEKYDNRFERIKRIVQRAEHIRRDRGDFPMSIGKEIKDVLSMLKIDDGYFCQTIKNGYGVTENTVKKYLNVIKRFVHSMKEALKYDDLTVVRKGCKISQGDIEKKYGICHQTISYIERKTNHKRRQEILSYVKAIAEERIKIAEDLCERIERLLDSDICWIRVKKVERIKNDNVKWVYDVTVEPTRSFISECLVLHNTISIAKASIVATLPAQTSILAGGNPKTGRFDPYLPIREQIEIPETLLSRFDLKFALRDIPNLETDSKMAEYILQARHYGEEQIAPEIDPNLLKKYVAYARKNCFPKLTKEAGEEIKKFYLELRMKSAEEGSPIAITPRQYEALIRLAEASAKVQLREEVNREDALRAISLMKFSLRQFGFDPETKKIDIDRAEGQKMTAAQRDKRRMMLDIINELTITFGKDIPIEEVLKRAEKEQIKNPEEIIEKMKREGDLFSPRPGYISKI
jgi:replicative DNA helicase Mcm